jgi:hypothetical protein
VVAVVVAVVAAVVMVAVAVVILQQYLCICIYRGWKSNSNTKNLRNRNFLCWLH